MLAKVLLPLFLFLLPFLVVFFIAKNSISRGTKSTLVHTAFPKSYPLIGSFIDLAQNRKRQRITQWTSDLLRVSPSATFVLDRQFGQRTIFTANPVNVHRILKSHFHIYQKGGVFRRTIHDFLGDGIFNADGENWKFQRQVSSHEFNTKSLRKFIETVVDGEITDRLFPVLSGAAAAGSVLDFQDILQRFAFDNICKIAFGFDPAYLSPSLPEARFAKAFEDGVRFSMERFGAIFPIIWKLKRFLGIGSEKHLRIAISEVREFARIIISKKKKELEQKSEIESVDLLSRFLNSGHSDETFVTDIIISFILAGRDTTSAALTWFFYLIAKNPDAEREILREIREKSEAPVFEEVKRMPYTHAALCESMRLYPPVPMDSKEAVDDDVWDDGTVVKKGMRVAYHPYAMGRSPELWGPDWAEYRPERWLRRENAAEKWSFVARDAYTYPVFQAGPRVCLGKEMSFLQMKKVVSSVLRRFRLVPSLNDDVEPSYLTFLTSKMKGGLLLLVEERIAADN